MDGPRDPFRVLSLTYDADLDDVRRAFRRLARETHPDRGGSAEAFHHVRAAYAVLTDDLEGARRRWRTAPTPPPRPSSRYPAGLDPRTYPTCTVRIHRTRGGTRKVDYDAASRPGRWTPGGTAPPGGACVVRYAATETAPAFGVWVVPLGAHRFRCVFGPHPALAEPGVRAGRQ
ncbi:J domain-containing protein [Rubrivirga sp.]|uniref:J domain-containing protein n=1 Tax=Rubrivirga sp. TaxID=1885344 RepID=UPI003B51D1A4